MFLTSTLERSSSAPWGRMEMLASQRKEPFSMSAVETPRYWRMARSLMRYWRASSDERMSGSLTISIRGTPARFTSMSEYR